MSAVIFDMRSYRMETKTKEERAIERIERELTGKAAYKIIEQAKARVKRLVNENLNVDNAVKRVSAWAIYGSHNDKGPKGAA